MLLGEWYYQQTILDDRCFKLICSHLAKIPDSGVVFPNLARKGAVAEDEEHDDVVAFQQVTAALTGRFAR